MEFYGLENYFSFACLAGACPSTCCAGWSIQVDEQDYHRFCQLERQELREDILRHIQKRDGKYFFQNRADGSCAMLDEDGLCRIQRNSSEEVLCNTCRKYPRLFRMRQGILYFSMAASCPVVSHALWQGKMSYIHGEESGKRCSIDGRKIPISRRAWECFDRQEEKCSLYRERIGKRGLFWDSLGRLFDILVEMLSELSQRERQPWEDWILLYEGIWDAGEGMHCMDASEGEDFFSANGQKGEPEDVLFSFFLEWGERWQDFISEYLAYRFMGRQAMVDEEPEETFCQSMGEAYLIQAACFLEYWNRGALSEEVICGWIQRVYRLCANGREGERKLRQRFYDFYQEKSLWISLLF